MVTKELEKDLSDEKFSDDFRKSVLGLFNVVQRSIEDAEDCALVQSQLPRINDLRAEAYRQIDVREPDHPGKATCSTLWDDIKNSEKPGERTKEEPVLPSIPQRTTEVINEISFFRSGKMLENEEDVEEYIIQLRERAVENSRREEHKSVK